MYKFTSCLLRNYKNIKCFNDSHLVKRHVSKNNSKLSPAGLTVSVLFSKKYLLASNTISSGLLMFVGDLCQQELEYRQNLLDKRYDYARLTRMFIVGLALGPIHHYYYIGIAKKWPERTTKIILWKIALDQFIMSPICIACFFFGLNALEMRPFKEAVNEFKQKFYAVYTADWLIWPPTQWVNFYYVNVKYQVLYINAITMLYNVFLSYIKHVHGEEVKSEHKLSVPDNVLTTPENNKSSISS
uniref:Mpv17-like protein 2 n=1 Tax=Diabrotica virgifera virgifera TaxID=50390 RepID=A0A6P7GXY6_DIAVI